MAAAGMATHSNVVTRACVVPPLSLRRLRSKIRKQRICSYFTKSIVNIDNTLFIPFYFLVPMTPVLPNLPNNTTCEGKAYLDIQLHTRKAKFSVYLGYQGILILYVNEGHMTAKTTGVQWCHSGLEQLSLSLHRCSCGYYCTLQVLTPLSQRSM